MDRQQLQREVTELRRQGKSIRAIAADLGVHRSSVHRALEALARRRTEQISRVDGLFVGRELEIADLKSAFEEALAASGRLVTLAGEPGIGKTRTAQEIAAYAEMRGAQVLWGRCYEGQGAPPYWPWVQVIRSYVDGTPPDRLRSAMGSVASDIAEVVPEVREALPDLGASPVLEPEQARFRLFDSVARFLRGAAEDQPLVLVLDSLDFADRASLLLLEFLAREMTDARLFVLGTYRDTDVSGGHPLSATLGEIAREPLFRQIRLGRLRREDVERFVVAAAHTKPSHELVEAVYDQTEGNPFFMTEAVRLLTQEGVLASGASTSSGLSIRIPESVRLAIHSRLGRLSPECRHALTVASVIGREFGLDQLGCLIDEPRRGRLVQAVEEARSARMIEEIPNLAGRYQFAHVLIQETLAGELPAIRRVELHAKIGEALEKLYGSDVEAHASELAHHFTEASSVVGKDKLVRHSAMAGEWALSTYAWEEALDHFQRALAAKEGEAPSKGSEEATDAETAALLFGMGRAQAAMDHRNEAFDSLSRALDYYAEAGDASRAVAIVETLPRALGRSGWRQLVARALKVAPPDSHQAGRILPYYGRSLVLEQGNYEEAREAFNHALAIARREEDVSLELNTLAQDLEVDYLYLKWEDALDKSRRVIDLTRDAGGLEGIWVSIAHYYAAHVLLLMVILRERNCKLRPFFAWQRRAVNASFWPRGSN